MESPVNVEVLNEEQSKIENRVQKNLKMVYIFVFLYLISEFLADEAYHIDSIFSGSFNFQSIPDLFIYQNFITVFSALFLLIARRTPDKNEIYLKRNFLASILLMILALNYLLKFYIFERLVSLQSVSMDSLPTNFSAFLPIEWFYIENNLRAFTDYDIGWDRIQFVITCISILSISAAGFILINLIRQKCIEIEFKKTFFEYRKVLISLQLSKKMLIISLFLTFVFLGIQNVRASDYRDITWEAEYIQEDMENFQGHLIRANEKILEFDKLEARKVAASAAFGDISNKDKRISSIGLSLWSGNLSDLRNGVFEWVILWKKALKEMSLKGYVEPELIFDLNQKYKEVSLLGVQSSPNLARSYTIDFWRKDFITLVK